MKRLLLTLFITLIFKGLTLGQTLTITIPAEYLFIDEENGLIVSRIDHISSFQNLTEYTSIFFESGDYEFEMVGIPHELTYTSAYLFTDNASGETYTCYFTSLPIIGLSSAVPIPDEPKTIGTFDYSDDEQNLSKEIGIELRGGSSQSYPKKNYDIEFWYDPENQISEDVNFGELRTDDDWILDAMYNEPLRIRSYLAHKFWLEMNALSYTDDEPNAKSGADVMYVEVFLNGNYSGVYSLSEQIDRKLLKIKSFNGLMRGELYKGISWGASTFASNPWYNNSSRIWSGYEMRYPKAEQLTDWSTLHSFTDFVIHSTDEEFLESIWQKFDRQNLIDYFIFLNLLRATDNTGKNIYLGKYQQGTPYFYSPWDLDGCLGTIWDGTEENITTDILTNGLINRVLELSPLNFNNDAAERWFELREHLFDEEHLISVVESQFQFFEENRIYEREALIYAEFSPDAKDLEYMKNWLAGRLAFLDDYFALLLGAPSIERKSSDLKLYPNPAKDQVHIKNNDRYLHYKCQIFNMLGEAVKEGIIRHEPIDLTHITSGMYVVVVGSKKSRLVVE